MGISVANLVALVKVQGAPQAIGEILGVGEAAKAAQISMLGLATGGIVVAGAAIVGVGAIAAKMAGDFQQSVMRLKTGGGDVEDTFGALSAGILKVSAATGVTGVKLAQDMYPIVSSGQRGAQALDTLAVAAKGAKIEQANVIDVANTLSGVMTNYGTKVFSATDYMNGLIKAVSIGKITLQELAVAMGPIDPIAKNLGISMSDVAAAMTTQTNAMIPAARAATGLRFLMQSLENPTGKASKAMKSFGLDTIAVAEEMKTSLPGALQMIYDAAKKAGPEGSVPFNRAISDMTGGVRSFTAFAALTGTHMADFVKGSKEIAAAMQAHAKEVQGWSDIQGNFNLKMDMTHAALDRLMIVMGTGLLPVLTNIVGAMAPILTALANWISSGQAATDIMTGFNNVMRVLSPTISFVATAIKFVSHAVSDVSDFFQRLVSSINDCNSQFSVFWGIVRGIGAFLTAAFKPVWEQLVTTFRTQLIPVWQDLVKNIQPLLPELKLFAQFLGMVLIVAIGLVISILGGLIAALAGLLKGVIIVFGGIVQIISGAVQVISGVIAFFVDLFTGKFDKLERDLNTIANGIINIFRGLWQVVVGIFTAAFGAIAGFVVGFIATIIGFFTHLSQILVGHSIIPDMINSIIDWFAQLPGRALGAVQSLAGMIGGFFAGLAGQAWSWGHNIIQGVVDGINGAAGSIGAAMASATAGAGGSLHAMGIPGFASGTSFAPGGMSWVGERGPELMYVPRGARITPNHQLGGSGGGGQSQITVNPPGVYLDGRVLAGALLPYLVDSIRYNTGVIM